MHGTDHDACSRICTNGVGGSNLTSNTQNTSGLTVEWNNKDITNGTIEIDEGGGNGVSLPIKYNGNVPGEDVWVMGESSDETVCNAGVSPDNKKFELYLSGNAAENDECKVRLLYGNNENPETLTLTVKVVAGIRLKIGDKIIKANETISGMSSASAQVFLGNTPLTNYDWSVQGTTVCAINGQTVDGTLNIKTIGNGYSNFSVSCTDDSNKEHKATFTWHGSGINDDADGARNMTLTLNEETKQAGEKFTLQAGTFTGKALFNGKVLKKTEYEVKIDGNDCNVRQQEDGTFTLTVDNVANGYYELGIKKKTAENEDIIEATFWIQAQNPTAYVLQFYNMEQLADGSWRNTGFATLGIFKKAKDFMYAKYIVTDEDMRRIDDSHFVDVTPENIEVVVRDEDKEDYVKVEDPNPFSFEMVSGQKNLMKISYDRSKDKKGPEYKLVYTNRENDKYLCIDRPEIGVENTLLLWTRSITELMSWNKLRGEDDSWNYNARKPSQEGLEDNEDCDIKDVTVNMPAELFGKGTEQITVAENKSTLTVETDLGNVTFDDKIMSQIDNADKDVILGIRKVEAEDEDYKKIEGALGGSSTIIDLSLEHQNGKISDFGTGTASVELTYEQKDKDKTPQVYYVDENGAKTAVKTQYDASSGKLTFETNHFSMYAVEEIKPTPAPSPGGNGGFVPTTPSSLEKAKIEAEKSLTAAVESSKYDEEGQKSIEAIIEKAKADLKNAKTEEEIKAVKEAAKNEIEAVLTSEEKAEIAAIENIGGSGADGRMKFIAKSKLTKRNGKRAVRIRWNVPNDMELDGFQVFRSTKKNKFGEKPYFTTKKNTYINTKNLKNGKTYYYKVRGFKEINGQTVYTDWSTKAYRTLR